MMIGFVVLNEYIGRIAVCIVVGDGHVVGKLVNSILNHHEELLNGWHIAHGGIAVHSFVVSHAVGWLLAKMFLHSVSHAMVQEKVFSTFRNRTYWTESFDKDNFFLG